jgi:hypothetical protein
METPRDNYELALAGAELGLRFIPCRPGTKVPLVKWKGYQTASPTPEMYAAWFRGTRNNIAVLTNGMVLFDCDSPEKQELVLGFCGPTPWRVRSPRGGVHLGYRKRKGVEVTNQVRVLGEPIDIRTDGGLALVPFSATEHGAYAFEGPGLVAVSELPVAKIGWTRERTRKRTVQCLRDVDETDITVRRARGYLAAIEGAISGQGGHRKTFRVACVLAHKFGLSFERAWPLFKEWNEQCEPPWSDAELTHKLRDAIEKGR